MNIFQGTNMSGKQIGYICISKIEKNTERQLNEIPLSETFTDKYTCKDTNRPALKKLIEFIEENYTVHAHDINPMARNTEKFLTLVKMLTE